MVEFQLFNMSSIFMHRNNRNFQNIQMCMFYNWQVLKQIHKLFVGLSCFRAKLFQQNFWHHCVYICKSVCISLFEVVFVVFSRIILMHKPELIIFFISNNFSNVYQILLIKIFMNSFFWLTCRRYLY